MRQINLIISTYIASMYFRYLKGTLKYIILIYFFIRLIENFIRLIENVSILNAFIICIGMLFLIFIVSIVIIKIIEKLPENLNERFKENFIKKYWDFLNFIYLYEENQKIIKYEVKLINQILDEKCNNIKVKRNSRRKLLKINRNMKS